MAELTGEALAEHLGFEDGMRVEQGIEPRHLMHPVAMEHHGAYFDAMSRGKKSARKFVGSGTFRIGEMLAVSPIGTAMMILGLICAAIGLVGSLLL